VRVEFPTIPEVADTMVAIAEDIVLTVQWGTANATNTISSGQTRVELMRADELS